MTTVEDRLRRQRTHRRIQKALLAFNILALILNLAVGSVFAIIPVLGIAALLWALHLNTLTVRNIKAANRPRPDYALIASLERGIYGRTFEHDGAPATQFSGVPPTPPRPRKRQTLAQDIEDDRRAMRELVVALKAEKARMRQVKSGVKELAGRTSCLTGHIQNGEPLCLKCDQARRR
jgi:hypothetical protein